MRYCLRCGKKFARNPDLKRHLIERKTPCNPKYLEIEGVNILDSYEDNYKIFIEKLKDLDIHDEIVEPVKKTCECEKCGIKFTQKKSYYRHRMYYCPEIRKEKNIRKLEEEIEKLNNIIKQK